MEAKLRLKSLALSLRLKHIQSQLRTVTHALSDNTNVRPEKGFFTSLNVTTETNGTPKVQVWYCITLLISFRIVFYMTHHRIIK